MPIKKLKKAVKKLTKRVAGKVERKDVKKAAVKSTSKPAKAMPKVMAMPQPVVKIAPKPAPKPAPAPAKTRKKLAKKELERYRARLLAERERILRELGRITEAINESAEEQEAAKQSYSNHLADLGTDYMEKEKNYYYADQEGQYLKSIEIALERIESGDYGCCVECGDLISEKRLEAVPAAELCISCKDKKEKLERSR